MMPSLWRITCCLCLLSPVVWAQTTQPATTPATTQSAPQADPAVVQLLDKLEAHGKTVQSMQANLHYLKNNAITNEKQIRIGTLDYANKDKRQFAVAFDKRIIGTRLKRINKRYVFDGIWLAEIDAVDKTFTRRQVVKPGEAFDPLALGRGPFPLPIGQKREGVLKLFQVTILPPTNKDPANTSHLKLIPRKTPGTGKNPFHFSQADLWFDNQSLLPVKVKTREVDEDGELVTATTVTLKNVVANRMTDAQIQSTFNTQPPKESGWKIIVKPFGDEMRID